MKPDGSGDTSTELAREVILRPAAFPELKPSPKLFANNVAKTSKYTWWNFVPKALFFQFRRLGNLYFLICGMLMLIGETDLNLYESPTSAWSTLGTLAAVLTVQLIIEATDDCKRAAKDRVTNSQLVLRVQAKPVDEDDVADATRTQLKETQWADLGTGDVIVVRKDESFPADVVILTSAFAEEGEFYIETKNIDGETALKLRSSLGEFHAHCTQSAALEKTPWSPSAAMRILQRNVLCVVYEGPNNKVYRFQGKLSCSPLGGPTAEPAPGRLPATTRAIASENMALQGSQLRNTPWVLGIVVYTGKDTKMSMNSKPTPTKQSTLDRQVNRAMGTVLVVQLTVVSLACILGVIWTSQFPPDGDDTNLWYLVPTPADSFQSLYFLPYPLALWIQFFILFNNFIPISMYVVSEMISLYHSLVFNFDTQLKHAETGIQGVCRSTQLTQELGLIEYIFSDKTGTLTKNKMTFEACAVGSDVYYTPAVLPPGLRDELKRGPIEGHLVDSDVEGGGPGRGGGKARPALVAPGFFLHSFSSIARTATASKPLRVETKTDRKAPDNGPGVPKLNLNAIRGEGVQQLLLMMSIAHSVTIEKPSAALGNDLGDSKVPEMPQDEATGPKYQAESPDELALVRAAADRGFVFSARTRGKICISYCGDMDKAEKREDTFKILAVNAFSSTRKRQSVVVQHPDGVLQLICKGADSHMLPRSQASSPTTIAALSKQLDVFGRRGLRTLVYSGKILSEEEFASWHEKFRAASNTVGDRETALAAAAEALEINMSVAGATAIEDELQDNVQQTIEKIHHAGIKLWVCTGDKLETAVNIGYSCNVLTRKMRVIRLVLEQQTMGHILRQRMMEFVVALRQLLLQGDLVDDDDLDMSNLTRVVDDIDLEALVVEPGASHLNEATRVSPVHDGFVAEKHCSATSDISKEDLENGVALVIEGSALHVILEDECLRKCLLVFGSVCQAVIACRVSPLQKAELVALVKKGMKPNPVTLAIGDGANDVSMIQEAHVGIGIQGLEGRQAVNSSDFSIPEFQGLQRLLFVHGTWNYRRMAKTVRYFLLKNAVFPLSIFFYNFWAGYSGTNPYTGWDMTLYNFFFTSFQIIFIGCLDRDISEECTLRLPELYIAGRLNLQLRPSAMMVMVLRALIYSFLLNIWPALLYPAFEVRGENDVLVYGTTMYTGLVLAMNARAAMLTNTWTWMNAAMLVLTILLYFAYQAVHSHFWWFDAEFWGTAFYCYSSPVFWACAVLSLTSCIVVDMTFEMIRLASNMTIVDLGRKIDNYLTHFTMEASKLARKKTRRSLLPVKKRAIDHQWTRRPSSANLSDSSNVNHGHAASKNTNSASSGHATAKDLMRKRQRESMEHYIRIVQHRRIQQSERTLTALVKRLSQSDLLDASTAPSGTQAQTDRVAAPTLKRKLSCHVMRLKSVVSSEDLVHYIEQREASLAAAKAKANSTVPTSTAKVRTSKRSKHKRHKPKSTKKRKHKRKKFIAPATSTDADSDGQSVIPSRAADHEGKTSGAAKPVKPHAIAESKQVHNVRPESGKTKRLKDSNTTDPRKTEGPDTSKCSCCPRCIAEGGRFRLQKLAGWRLIFSIQLCAITMIGCALVMGSIGVAIVVHSDGIVAHQFIYNSSSSGGTGAAAVTNRQGSNAAAFTVPMISATTNWITCDTTDGVVSDATSTNKLSSSPCTTTVSFPERMTSPIFVYYGVQNMYQNHLVYFASYNIDQLHGNLDAQTAADCRHVVSNTSGKELVPCGLPAQALFTDSFRISARGGPQNGIPLINSSNIAWETDTQYRFQNAENWNSDENRQIYEFLNETFAAVPDKLSTELSQYGVESQHFNVWMRSAALPSFYNLWGRIDAVESLEPDMTYNLTIERSFNAPRFGGQTSLLFVSGISAPGTTNPRQSLSIADPSHLVGRVLLVTASILLVVGFTVWVASRLSPDNPASFRSPNGSTLIKIHSANDVRAGEHPNSTFSLPRKKKQSPRAVHPT